MRIFKQVISTILITVLFISTAMSMPLNSSAIAEDVTHIEANDNLGVAGTSTLGNMLAAEYTENSEKEFEEDTGYSIVELIVDEKTAYVHLQTLKDSILVVALYDDIGRLMYTSARREVTYNDTVVSLNFDIDTMPETFLVKAYLLDKVTNIPLCKEFECVTYTARMQEFLCKTIEDFDEEKVLNLDEDSTNNFLVYNDDVILIEGTDDINVIMPSNQDDDIYIIENIDETISSLKNGDVFSLSLGDFGDVLILKINSITIDDTIATIEGEELEITEVFDYIKIDLFESVVDPVVDVSDLDEGVEYLGKEEATVDEVTDEVELASVGSGSNGYRHRPNDQPISFDETLWGDTFKFALDSGNGVSASLSAKFGMRFQCYFDMRWLGDYDLTISVGLVYDLNATIDITLAKFDLPPFKLAEFSYSPVFGVTISYDVSFVVRANVKLSISTSLKGEVGAKFENGSFSTYKVDPKATTELKVKGTLFVGLSTGPSIEILENLLEISAKYEKGIEITATFSTKQEEDAEKIHNCSWCIQGDVHLKADVQASLSILGFFKFGVTSPLYKIKLRDFNYNIADNIFEWTVCDNYLYRQTVIVLDKNNKPILDIEINDKPTDSNGAVVIYLPKGTQDITVKKDDIIQVFTCEVKEAGTLLLYEKESGFVIDSIQPVSITGMCGDNVSYLYCDGCLEISGTGPMYDYEESGYAPWFGYEEDITTVNIKDGVTSIGANSFEYCYMIEQVVIPESVIDIRYGAFSECTRLKEVTIPQNVTTIGDRAFYKCYNLTDITIPDSVTSIGVAAFNDCKQLEVITISGDVKSIGDGAFCGTSYYDNSANWEGDVLYIGKYLIEAKETLEECEIKEGTTLIADAAFKDKRSGASASMNFYSLKKVTIPSSVKYIGREAFESCEKLSIINIPDSVISIEDYAFRDCSELSNIILSNNLINIGMHAFYNTAYYNDNSNWKNDVLYIGTYFIEGKDSVKEYTIKPGTILIADYAFAKCDYLTTIIVPEGVIGVGDRAFSFCRYLKNIALPDSLTYIGDYAFEVCESLTSISVPENVTSIGLCAFESCYSLTYINIPAKVTSIGDDAFDSCSDLTAIDVDEANPNYCSIDGVLYNRDCTQLIVYPENKSDTSYTIPSGVITISPDAFEDNRNLEKVVIPNSVVCIGFQAFNGCNLTSVDISDGVKIIADEAFHNCNLSSVNIPASVKVIGKKAFEYCPLLNIDVDKNNTNFSSIDGVLFNKELTTILKYPSAKIQTTYVIPDSVTKIGDRAFSSCEFLTDVTIPNKVYKIGDYAFLGCSSIKSIVLPESVTTIGEGAFYNSTGLTTVTLSNFIEKIHTNAFSGCVNITDVYYTGTQEQWDKLWDKSGLTSATLHLNYESKVSEKSDDMISADTSYIVPVGNSVGEFSADDTMKIYSSSNLIPGTEAILVIMEGLIEKCSVSISPILYISQTTVDENGFANFTAYGEFSDKYWVAVIYGLCNHSKTKWETVCNATADADGLEICICELCSETITTQVIPSTGITVPTETTTETTFFEPETTESLIEPTSAPDENLGFIGDVDGNGKINIKDATAIQKHIAKLIAIDETKFIYADTDKDNKITVKDATRIQKFLAQIIPEL